MLLVLQMEFKILNRETWTRNIQTVGTINAPYARQILEFDIGWHGSAWVETNGRSSVAVDGGVAHEAFEAVVRVFFVKSLEGGDELGSGRRL